MRFAFRKGRPEPAADFYEVKLRDFFKLPAIDGLTRQQIEDRMLIGKAPSTSIEWKRRSMINRGL